MANKNKIDQHTLESMDVNIIMMEDKNMLHHDIMAQVTQEDLIDFYTQHNKSGFMTVDITQLSDVVMSKEEQYRFMDLLEKEYPEHFIQCKKETPITREKALKMLDDSQLSKEDLIAIYTKMGGSSVIKVDIDKL